eukprot:COSAG06_NODE_570_length_14115_cov_11.866010_6_plen_95_part_00
MVRSLACPVAAGGAPARPAEVFHRAFFLDVLFSSSSRGQSQLISAELTNLQDLKRLENERHSSHAGGCNVSRRNGWAGVAPDHGLRTSALHKEG